MEEARPQRTEQPTAAFVLSLLAGLWMLAGGMMGSLGWGGMMGMMGGWQGAGGWMWGLGGMQRFGAWAPWSGAVAGIIVLIGSVMLYVKPAQRRSWGVAIIVASALNIFLGMMGLLAGTLGVVGGVLALGTKD
jgi:hypothetical protein